VVLDEISKHIREAPFFPLALDETSNIQIGAQLDTVLRYILVGKIHEGLVSSLTDSSGLFIHV
jgi:hypothetical protein